MWVFLDGRKRCLHNHAGVQLERHFEDLKRVTCGEDKNEGGWKPVEA
jgi:hypothetical protein